MFIYSCVNLNMMRIALKIAYIGTDYHGFQVQPDVNTIEGELFRALKDLNIINNLTKRTISQPVVPTAECMRSGSHSVRYR